MVGANEMNPCVIAHRNATYEAVYFQLPIGDKAYFMLIGDGIGEKSAIKQAKIR